MPAVDRCELALVAARDGQLRPVQLRLEDRRLPLSRQVLESVGLEQRLAKLSTLEVAQF